MSRPKDMQKARVYASESFPQRSALAKRLLGPGGKKYTTGTPHIEAVQDYLDAIVTRRWFVSRFGSGWKISAVLKSGGSAYGGSRGYRRARMTLPVFARSEPTILHELAHCLTNHRTDIAHHGPEFAGVYLELIRYQVGKEAAALVRSKFNEKPKVRWNKGGIPWDGYTEELQAAKRP